MRSPEALTNLMLMPNEIQLNQIRSRQDIIRAWGIKEGMSLLEIGCGQGDTTVVLADAVGPFGHVLATDLSGPEYGAPMTLGQATAHLATGELGGRLNFCLGWDVLNCSLPTAEVDGAVMAHCSWYFQSPDVLMATLERLRQVAHRLFFSEWDLAIQHPEQTAHYMAVQAQKGMDLYEANVRTPLTRSQIKLLIESAGWGIVRDSDIDTSGLEDGRWEVELFPAVKASLEHLSESKRGASLNSFAIVAER